ncbi:3'-5' exonuclease [Klebsiella quasipneumoniae]|uniref:3'-5' exonuclease n=1 Tax=Klebsiella quasipneumoniae subsp. quasipneumoniae TaxID=1667327 RepID=A0AAW8XWB9_9ENTR|nr:3'-5' exonuclease [Klebsiella quasipneumoniae]MDV0844687.1 3'-5' exonuclease [Klebsiella quasipneumoniae subsp. quasipneumoniae]
MKKAEGVFENRVNRLVSGLKFVTSTQTRKISDEDKQVLKEAMAVCNRLLAEPPVTIPNTKTPTPIIPMESAITLTATTSLIRAGTLALDWLRQLPVFIDTETTGFERFAQVIELAITDASGNVLFESKLRPTVTINPKAQEVHGINLSSLKSAPTWPQVAEKVRSLLDGRKIIAYNAPFDSRMMKQTAAAFGDPFGWWSDDNVLCAMKLSVDAFDIPKKTLKLADAMAYAELSWQGKAHTALADTQAMARLVSAISTFGKHREIDVATKAVVIATPAYANQGRPWEDKDIHIILEQINQGDVKVTATSTLLGRSPYAIALKAVHLGFKNKAWASTFKVNASSDFAPRADPDPPLSTDADSPYGNVYSDAMQHMKSITGRPW